MSPERWQEIEKVYDAARGCEADKRTAFLDKACAGDDDLRREIEWMLAHENEAHRFMPTPAVEAGADAHYRFGRLAGRRNIRSLPRTVADRQRWHGRGLLGHGYPSGSPGRHQ